MTSATVLRRSVRLLTVATPGVAGRGTQFLALAWFATIVTPAEYGALSVLQALVIGAASVVGSTVGVTANTTAATQRGIDAPLTLAVTVVRLRARLLLSNLLVSVVVVTAGAAVLMHPRTAWDLAPAVVAGLASGAVSVAEILTGVCAGLGQARRAASIDAVRGVGGGAAALVAGSLLGAPAAVTGLLAVDVGVALLVLVHLFRTDSRIDLSDVPAQEGALAGVTANLLGQASSWVVLATVDITGGAVALGVFGVATRFASMITIAPVHLGKHVVADLVPGADGGRGRWTPRSFAAAVAVLCAIGSSVSLVLLVAVFHDLVDRYPGLLPTTLAVLVSSSVRALLISVGQVCVARRAWRTWIFADLAACLVTAVGSAAVLAAHGTLLDVVLVSGLGSVAGIVTRLAGLRRASRTGAAR